ncbi:hypothetical protein C8N36_113116 [Pelagimonas varians]|uniref:Uncharacterized protein n=1 Tax=Pelagimonas varians TaxID=696760 RepID=A0A238KVR2_9RHOB|nr:hypothetical protein C8N36_113116 [Pelagimonas varians]SMX46787.1 hypothetical protein PEV8663_03386 [Pelagimonas varians]
MTIAQLPHVHRDTLQGEHCRQVSLFFYCAGASGLSPPRENLMHRSPPVLGTGETRLLLVLEKFLILTTRFDSVAKALAAPHCIRLQTSALAHALRHHPTC